MLIAKIWIVFNAILYAGIGLLSLIAPHYVASVVGYALTTPGAIAELKACYGGLMISFAVLMLLMLSKQMINECMLFLIIIYAGFGLGRITGIIGNQAFDRTTLIYVTFEIFSVVFSYFLMKRVV